MQKLAFRPFLQIVDIVKPNGKTDAALRSFKTRVLTPLSRVFFDKKDVELTLLFLKTHVKVGYDTWFYLFPSAHSFPDIDFGILCFPATGVPILFAIQVSVNLMSHDKSDKDFRYGRSVNGTLVQNPLMEAYRNITMNEGRVQFIWVGREDVHAAKGSKRFDQDSWITDIYDWKTFSPTGAFSPAAIDTSNLGYVCKLETKPGEKLKSICQSIVQRAKMTKNWLSSLFEK